MEIAMDVLSNFSDFDIKNDEISQRAVNEMEHSEEEFHATYETARKNLYSRKTITLVLHRK